MNTQDTTELLPSPDVLHRLAISESGFIFDPATGNNFTVNETGVELLHLLQKNLRLDELLHRLAEEYDADPRTIERDVLDFLGALREHVGG